MNKKLLSIILVSSLGIPLQARADGLAFLKGLIELLFSPCSEALNINGGSKIQQDRRSPKDLEREHKASANYTKQFVKELLGMIEEIRTSSNETLLNMNKQDLLDAVAAVQKVMAKIVDTNNAITSRARGFGYKPTNCDHKMSQNYIVTTLVHECDLLAEGLHALEKRYYTCYQRKTWIDLTNALYACTHACKPLCEKIRLEKKDEDAEGSIRAVYVGRPSMK